MVAAEELGLAAEAWDDLTGAVVAALEAWDDEAGGEVAAASEPLVAGAGNALEALGAEPLLGFAACAAACLHPSDSASLCSLRQATIRPPPCCTPAHSLCASWAQAARIAARGSSASADPAARGLQRKMNNATFLTLHLVREFCPSTHH